MRRMIILTNTCPFGGEVFLQNELKWVPEDQRITVYPIYARAADVPTMCLTPNVEARRFESAWSGREVLRAGFNSMRMLFSTKEYSAAVKKPGALRNLIKALKFAFVSELRAGRIAAQLEADGERKEGFILYSYWLYEAAYIAARLKESFPGSRFVSRCHGYDLYEIRHPNGYLPFREYIMGSADAVNPISEDGKAYLDQLYEGKWNDKVQVMRLGTDDHGMNPEKGSGVPTLVSVSNLVSVKRVDRIIDSLKDCKQPVRWYHFGDGPLREELEQRAKTLPAHIEYRFMGAVPNETIMDFYRENHVDVFLNVSASEGVPVSIMEALSFGIPVVATDVGGTHEIVLDGQNGYLLPCEFDSGMLMKAVRKTLDEKNRDKLCAQARIIWEQNCDAGIHFQKFIEVLTR